MFFLVFCLVYCIAYSTFASSNNKRRQNKNGDNPLVAAYTYLNRGLLNRWSETEHTSIIYKPKNWRQQPHNSAPISMKTLLTTLATIAALNPEGYTVDAHTLQPVTSGYVVAVKGTQNSFGDSGLRRVVEYQRTHKECTAFGGWLDTDSGLYYYDACVIVPTLGEAMALAKANEQIAFFCLDNFKEYNQDGTERK